MKTSIARLILTAGLYFLTLAAAQCDTGFVALEIGGGDIDIDEPERLPFDPVSNSSDNALAFSFGGGFMFSSGVYVDLAYTDLDAVTLFGLADVFGFSTFRIGVGYKFAMNESFAFLAKTGLSFWDLDVREGFFLNPGPEASDSFDGTDMFLEFGAEYNFGERFGLTLIHTRDTYDLGNASATRIGVRYYFDSY